MSVRHENYKLFYERFTHSIRRHPRAVKALSIFDKLLAVSFVVAYPLFLALVLFGKPFHLLFTLNKVGLPALCFCTVTLLRWLIKKPRPYETMGAGIEPLTKKRGTGNSMPSRHIASAFVISLVILPEYLLLGIACLVAAIALTVLRFVEGVHYPSDLLVGALLGITFGVIGLF